MRGRTVVVLLLASCATGGKLQANVEVTRTEIEKARKSGAMKCAPRELALAEANVEFAVEEMRQGNAGRAERHLAVAEKTVNTALAMSTECGPKLVTVARAPVVRIEKTDADGDGIPDDVDRCPLDPEDKDGFQDEDGCPDPDNDNDGIVDAMDACPNNPGPLENRGCPVLDRDGDGVPDNLDKCPDEPGLPPDGCPKKYTLVEVKHDRIEIKQQVHFATRKWKVLRDSYKLLNQVLQVLRDYPKMRLRIEGHTDNVGGEAFNLKLSQRRADAVRAYLTGKGVESARLEAVGFGLMRPIASNRAAKGRAQNRRTEFHIISIE